MAAYVPPAKGIKLHVVHPKELNQLKLILQQRTQLVESYEPLHLDRQGKQQSQIELIYLTNLRFTLFHQLLWIQLGSFRYKQFKKFSIHHGYTISTQCHIQ